MSSTSQDQSQIIKIGLMENRKLKLNIVVYLILNLSGSLQYPGCESFEEASRLLF